MNIQQRLRTLIENWPAKVVCLVIAVFLSQLYRATLLEKRYLVLPLTVKNESSLTPAEQYPSRVKVMLWGDAAGIGSISEDDIIASIDLSDIKTEGVYQIPVETRFIGAFTSLGSIEISAEPALVTLRLVPSARKLVPVILSLEGIPADGYEITKSSLEPAAVEIEGPAHLVEKVYGLKTEPVSVDGRTNGFSAIARIIKDEPLISIAGKGEVRSTVKINETIIQKQFDNLPIYFDGLNQDLAFSTNTDADGDAAKDTGTDKNAGTAKDISNITGSIEVQGPKRLLKTWSPPEHILTVSCETITEPGTYTLPVEALLPEGYAKFEIVHSSPQSVQVTIEWKKDTNRHIQKIERAPIKDTKAIWSLDLE